MRKIFTLILLSFSLSVNSQNTITWGTTMDVASSSTGNLHPRIVMDATGDPVAIWGRASDESVFFSRWTGSSFTAPAKLNGTMTVATANWMGPDIASKGDTMYVVMKETPEADTSSHIYIVRSVNGGMTWSMPMKVDNVLDSITRFPTVTIDALGNPIVAFMKFDPNFGNARWVVARSVNLGATFITDRKASGWSGPGSDVCDCCPGSITRSANNVCMLYRDAMNNYRDTWMALSTNTGNSFTNGMNVDQNDWMLMNCPGTGPDGVIIGDTLYTTFMNGSIGVETSYYSATSISTMTAAPTRPLTGTITNLNGQTYPRIDKYGNALAIVWTQSVNNMDELCIRFTVNMNAGLSSPYTSVDMNNVRNTDVALWNGVMFVVWEDDNSGTVKYRKGTFTPASVADPSTEDIFSIYPNPSTGMLNVRASEKGEMNILNSLGEEVGSWKLEAGNNTMDLSAKAKGVYFVKVVAGGKMAVRKIAIE